MTRCSPLREAYVPSAIITSDISVSQWTMITKLVKCGDCYVKTVIGELVDFSIAPSASETPQIILIKPTECILIGDLRRM